jgi:hypothetical protein
VDVTVQNRHGAEAFDQTQRLFRIIGAPTPFGINRPERNVGEEDDRDAARKTGDISTQPIDLIGAEGAEPARFEVEDVDESDEVDAGVIEAVPAVAFAALPVTL